MEHLVIQNDSASEISDKPQLQNHEIKGKVGPLYRVLYYPRNVKHFFDILIIHPGKYLHLQLFNHPAIQFSFFLNHSVNIPTLQNTEISEACKHIC